MGLPFPNDRDDREVVDAWCALQLHPWTAHCIDKAQVAAKYAALNAESGSVWLFRFKGRSVRAERKERLDTAQAARATWLAPRARAYHKFFSDVARTYPFERDVSVLIDLEDNPAPRGMIPVFSFQKGKNDDFILLPDIDLLTGDFFEGEAYRDRIEYKEKSCRAVFVGSTTGSLHTAASVAQLSNERLAAGVYYKMFDEIDFRLPNVVQCADDAAKQAILALGLGTEMVTWREQFQSKFVISLDGNGATCSRVAIALASNCVLLKYNSDRVLHYFSSLVPWQHYIPIRTHADVVAVVRDEGRNTGKFEPIASASQDFFKKYLSRSFSMFYAHTLITRLGRLLDNEPRRPQLRTFGSSHVCHLGDIIHNGAAPWIGRPGSRLPLEAFLFSVEDQKNPLEIYYRGYSANHEPMEWHNAGDMAGQRGVNFRFFGLEIEIGESIIDTYAGLLEVIFIDGARKLVQINENNFRIVAPLPIESFCFMLRHNPTNELSS